MYPKLATKAAAAMARIHATAPVLVVSDGFMIQHGNDAITVKGELQAKLYRTMVRNEYERLAGQDGMDSGQDVEALVNRIVIDAILVKHKVMVADPHIVDARLWHEYGHVLYGAPENGQVFAHEIRLMTQYHPEHARAWVLENRTLQYLVSVAVEPGVDELITALTAVLAPDDMQRFRELLAAHTPEPAKEPKEEKAATQSTTQAPTKARPKFRVVMPGESQSGTLTELREALGQEAAKSNISAQTVEGDVITFGAAKWLVQSIVPAANLADVRFTLVRQE